MCTKCGTEFDNLEEYEKHEGIHHTTNQKDTEMSELQNLIFIAILEK